MVEYNSRSFPLGKYAHPHVNDVHRLGIVIPWQQGTLHKVFINQLSTGKPLLLFV